ncbi:methyltransferase domain-containing protein [Streptomyces sp. 351MFTsu5.1]|uniref:class I SAM-dependent methyltransferase n=1 Tax=Streptomyces sp. 351MFTsu5.1 TaxID=1172180 RepID=UPI000374B657
MPAPTAPSVRRLRSTARALRWLPEPESWLDVGTGDADFPEAARTFFPYTAFDGIDPTPRVLHAQAVERLEEGYRGALTDPHLAGHLRARYDVVSLLNRSADPGELRAALAVLRPGGHLLVESPDDPRPALESQGCAIVATSRRSAHIPPRLAPHVPPDLLPVARALDHTASLLLSGTRFARTYRVIARKPLNPGRGGAGGVVAGRESDRDAGAVTGAARDADARAEGTYDTGPGSGSPRDAHARETRARETRARETRARETRAREVADGKESVPDTAVRDAVDTAGTGTQDTGTSEVQDACVSDVQDAGTPESQATGVIDPSAPAPSVP